jgi:hypothetical protein
MLHTSARGPFLHQAVCAATDAHGLLLHAAKTPPHRGHFVHIAPSSGQALCVQMMLGFGCVEVCCSLLVAFCV